MGLFGLGGSAVAMSRLIGTWFEKSRGFALGITLAGGGISAILAPIAIGAVIVHLDWRSGYLVLGLSVLMATPLVYLFREGPHLRDDVELLQDSAIGGSWGFLKAPLLIALFTAISLLIAGSLGLAAHLVPLLIDMNISPMRAAELASLMGVLVVGGRILAGYLLDHMSAILIAVSISLIATAACLMVLGVGTAAAVPAALFIGIVLGVEFDLMAFMVIRYFGLKLYGRVYGVIFAGAALMTALSPLVVGLLYGWRGNYLLPLILGTSIFTLASFVFWSVTCFIEGSSFKNDSLHNSV